MVFLFCVLSATEGLLNSARPHTVSFAVDIQQILETQVDDEKLKNRLLFHWNIVFIIAEK